MADLHKSANIVLRVAWPKVQQHRIYLYTHPAQRMQVFADRCRGGKVNPGLNRERYFILTS